MRDRQRSGPGQPSPKIVANARVKGDFKGLVLSAIGVFIVTKTLGHGATFAGRGPVLTSFGMIDGVAAGVVVSSLVARADTVLSGCLIGLAWLLGSRDGAAPAPSVAHK